MAKPAKPVQIDASFDGRQALAALDDRWKEGLRMYKEKVRGTGMAIVAASFGKIWRSVEILETYFGPRSGVKANPDDPDDPFLQVVNDLSSARTFATVIVSRLLEKSSHRDKTAFLVAIGHSLQLSKAIGPKQNPDTLPYVRFAARELLKKYIKKQGPIPTLGDIRSQATLHYEKQ